MDNNEIQIVELDRPETTQPKATQTTQGTTGTTDTGDGQKPSVFLAVPCYGCCMTTLFLMCVLRLQAELAKKGIDLEFEWLGNESLVPRARNILAARFLQSKATHLLFIDADIGFQTSAVVRLLEADKDIATAVYPKKAFDWEVIQAKLREKSTEPTHMMGLDYNINLEGERATVVNGFVPVLDAATGFMLIKREVLERMNEVYAEELTCKNDLPGRGNPGYVENYVALFDCMIDPDTRRYLSEDYGFVRRAQKAGYKIHADIASPLCHVGQYIFQGDLRQRFSMVYRG